MANRKLISAERMQHFNDYADLTETLTMHNYGWNITKVSGRGFVGVCVSCKMLILDNTPHFKDGEDEVRCEKCGTV